MCKKLSVSGVHNKYRLTKHWTAVELIEVFVCFVDQYAYMDKTGENESKKRK